MENDYSQTEIDNMINELLIDHISKLKEPEIKFIDHLYFVLKNKISQEQRDKLIKLYDGVRDIPGE